MGGQKGIAFFYRFLAPLVNLTCVTTKNNDAVEIKDYEVQKILSNSKLRYINVFYFFTIRKIIHEKKITHLIIEHPYYGWLAFLLKRFCQVKLIVHSHNIEALRFKSVGRCWWRILWHYEKFTHRISDVNFFIHDDDRNYAIENFKLKAEKCFTITYGFELTHAPSEAEKLAAKKIICSNYGINQDEKILLFNGTLDYQPNLDALNIILENINPILFDKKDFKYRIIICGKKLPVDYDNLISYKEKNIIYAGFVDDINVFFKGADIFINPVMEGGGIKTKVVEALGYNLTVISTRSGATGIPSAITGDKMKIITDDDWPAFANQIFSLNTDEQILSAFFDHFYWENIAEKAAAALSN